MLHRGTSLGHGLATSDRLVGPNIVPFDWSHSKAKSGETFQRRKLLQIVKKYDFCRENFHKLFAFAAAMDPTPPNFAEKLPWIATKLVNL